MLVEVVIGGIAISTTLPPPPSAGPVGTGPPCGAVMGPFGWLIAFWVRKTIKDYLNNLFFMLLQVNPTFLRHKHILVGHSRPFVFHGNFISTSSRLTAWKAYGYWKEEVNTPLFNIIWRDGLLYFFVIFTMNAANVIILSTTPQALRAVNLTLIR